MARTKQTAKVEEMTKKKATEDAAAAAAQLKAPAPKRTSQELPPDTRPATARRRTDSTDASSSSSAAARPSSSAATGPSSSAAAAPSASAFADKLRVLLHAQPEIGFFVTYNLSRWQKMDKIIKQQQGQILELREIIARAGHRSSGEAAHASAVLEALMSSNATLILHRLKVRPFATFCWCVLES
jgi:hypothetical protein